MHPHHTPFGSDRFGVMAERFARFFGTPKFIIGQTIIVAVWIALNIVVVSFRWDPYPFILLNLMFSTQAAYAAPLILLAQTRQADRDLIKAQLDAKHRDEAWQAEKNELDILKIILEENTELTAQIHALVHASQKTVQ